MALNNLLQKYENLFFDEVYYNGFQNVRDTILAQGIRDVNFAQNFEKHLDFYEANLFQHPVGVLGKVADFLMYHIEQRESINAADEKTLEEYVNRLRQRDGSYLVESQAFFSLRATYAEYIGRNFSPIPCIEAVIKSPREGGNKNLVKDFAEWQLKLYGLPLIEREEVRDGAHKAKEAKEESYRTIPEEIVSSADLIPLADGFNTYFEDFLGEELGFVNVRITPDYLKEQLPSAAAYTFDRLLENPEQLVFVGEGRTASTLLFTLSHEVLGHILQDRMIRRFCSEDMKKLPGILGFALGEGFGLLVEDFIVEVFKSDIVARYFERAFPQYFSAETTPIALEIIYHHYRLLRHLRYLFELEVWADNREPLRAISDLSKEFSYDENELGEDLLSFLPTPGYASCYIGGYALLKELGLYSDREFRKEIARTGNDPFPLFGGVL